MKRRRPPHALMPKLPFNGSTDSKIFSSTNRIEKKHKMHSMFPTSADTLVPLHKNQINKTP